METINEYEKQAEDFLQKTETTLVVRFDKYDFHFDGDTDKRDIYSCSLIKGNRVFNFKFGNSVNSSGEYIVHATKERIHAMKNKFGKLSVPSSIGIINRDFYKNEDFKVPTAYDVLSCLQKSDVGSFEDFCSEFGYETDSRKAEKIYNAVLNEWNNIKMLFSDDEIEKLQEI